MPEPYDYSIDDVPSPTQSFLQGIQTVDALRQREQQIADAEKARVAEQQRQLAAAQLAEKIRNRTVTRADYEAGLMANPKEYQAFKTAIDSLASEQKNNLFSRGMPVYAALFKGTPESLQVAAQLLETDFNAASNRQDKEQAGQIRMMQDLLKNGQVDALMAQVGSVMQAIDPKRFSEASDEIRKQQTQPFEKRKAAAEAAEAESEAEKAKVEAAYIERMQKANLKKLEREINTQGEDRVQSSSIKPDGTVVIVTSKGLTRVIGPDGVELTGQARMDAVRDSEQFGADIQALRAGARTSGEIGQKEAQKAFESVGKVRQNLSNLDQAVAALDAGANTGVISSKLPNWKASTIELRNIQNRLGLDVIGSVTFGALSEGELSLALETALPLNMNEKELRNWLLQKKAAQSKVADYLSEQARYLSVPGRTVGQWMDFAEKKYGATQPDQPEAPRTGGQPVAPTMPAGFRVIR